MDGTPSTPAGPIDRQPSFVQAELPLPAPVPRAREGAAPQRTIVRVLSGDFVGIEGRPVEVQVDVSARGYPGFHIVGLPGKSIRESRERIRAALRNCGFKFPHDERVVINLAPTAEQKEGSGFDLAVTLGLLLASRQLTLSEGMLRGDGLVGGVGFLGEVGLNGEIRPVPGALLVAHALKERGTSRIVVPRENARETALVEGMVCFAAGDLHEAVAALQGRLPAFCRDTGSGDAGKHALLHRDMEGLDFAEVKGQEASKRGLIVAAAGEHNLLMVGPPGVGKTMLARRLPGILPPLDLPEGLEVARISSVLGQVVQDHLVRSRPFRSPHHTISYVGLVGGGTHLKPGEVTRAHRGVLFLDEFPEFNRRALEALREPLEEGRITVSRSAGTVTFPARFLLVAAMNPCPCGYLGHPRRACSCTPQAIRVYRQRISGPLLDRMDLFLEVGSVPVEVMLDGGRARPGLGSSDLRELVRKARGLQALRWGERMPNSQVPLGRLLAGGCLRKAALDKLREGADHLGLSARGFTRLLRVARTVADLEGARWVEAHHLSEALHYREPLAASVGERIA